MKIDTLFRSVSDTVRDRISDGIEQNRKRNMILQFRDPAGNPLSIHVLELELEQHAFLFGCGAFPFGELSGEARSIWETLCPELFSLLVTPIVWGEYEPEKEKYRYAADSPHRFRRPPVDQVLTFAREHGMQVKGHALMTHLSVPCYFPKEKEAARVLTREHYRDLARRYDGAIAFFDGVNEPLSHPATRERAGAFFRDADYEEWNFRAIKAAFHQSRIFANENFHPDVFHGKNSPFYLLLNRLLEQGVGIDGIGLYYHLNNTLEELTENFDGFLNPASILERLDCYAAFEKPIHLSELSIPVIGGDEGLQERIAYELIRTFFSHPSLTATVWWNVISGMVQEGEEELDPGLLRQDMTERPACRILRQLLKSEWHTRLALRDCGKSAAFRGFCGTYRYRLDIGTRETYSGRFRLPETPEKHPYVLELTCPPAGNTQ